MVVVLGLDLGLVVCCVNRIVYVVVVVGYLLEVLYLFVFVVRVDGSIVEIVGFKFYVVCCIVVGLIN